MATKQQLQDYIQVLRLKTYTGAEAIGVLRKITAFIRPKRRKDSKHPVAKCTELIALLEADPRLKEAMGRLLATIFIQAHITDLVTESGIVTGATFGQQMRKMMNSKIIPPYKEPGELSVVMDEVFYKKWDWQWAEALPEEQVAWFFNIARQAFNQMPNDLELELTNAARILSYRIASLGLEKEVFMRADRRQELVLSFTEQNRELHEYLQSKTFIDKNKNYNDLLGQLARCKNSLQQLEQNSVQTGTSINQTFLLRRLNQLIDRLAFILQLYHQPAEVSNEQLSAFFKQTLHNHKKKNDVSSFISSNLNLLAYRIVEHKKETGEHYITSTRREYGRIFLSACGGGFIVSMLVVFKFLIGKMQLPVFWEGFLFSVNYAFGFIAIQLLHFTLATKQPAMTASVLAGSLKGSGTGRNTALVEMAITASRVSRSQFVSIIGNVIMVFPFTFLWMTLYQQLTGDSLVNAADAAKLLKSNHPGYSLSILYASIAGIFLFTSGILSGYFDNRVVYSKIPERLPHQPFLKRFMPRWMLARFIRFVKNNTGAIMGNAALGVFLGMAAFLGKITGLPFDIRHITFAGGNVMMGIFGGGSSNILFVFFCLLGVLFIGFINLIVSFLLAFYLAMKSRGLRFRDYPDVGRIVWKHFTKNTREFFFPPKHGRSALLADNEQAMITSDLGIS
jgi:site-specific recombinase